jgi:hypothetical protein
VLGVFFLGNLFIAIILDRFSFCASAESDDAPDEYPLLYVTVFLQRVTREIAQRVRRANELVPSRSGRSTKASSRRGSGSNTPIDGTQAPTPVGSPSGELVSRASFQSARTPDSVDVMEIFNDVETTSEGTSSEKQNVDGVGGAVEDAPLDFEEVKAALRRALSTQGGSAVDEKRVVAAANEMDRLVRSRSRSRSVSRRRAQKASSSGGETDANSDDENRSDDDEETSRALQRQKIQQQTQVTRGRPVVSRAHSQRARLKAASMRMGTNVVTSRYASSDSEDVSPPRVTQTQSPSGGSLVNSESDSSGDESFDSRL